MHPIVSILPMHSGKFLDSCDYKECCSSHSGICHPLHTHIRISLEQSFPNLTAHWNHVGINTTTAYWCVAHPPSPPPKAFWLNWYRVWLACEYQKAGLEQLPSCVCLAVELPGCRLCASSVLQFFLRGMWENSNCFRFSPVCGIVWLMNIFGNINSTICKGSGDMSFNLLLFLVSLYSSFINPLMLLLFILFSSFHLSLFSLVILYFRKVMFSCILWWMQKISWHFPTDATMDGYQWLALPLGLIIMHLLSLLLLFPSGFFRGPHADFVLPLFFKKIWLCWVLVVACIRNLLLWRGLSRRAGGGILVSWPGIEPVSPSLEGELLTNGPLGKSLVLLLWLTHDLILVSS